MIVFNHTRRQPPTTYLNHTAMMKEPNVSVGIVNAQKIKFRLNAKYSTKAIEVTGEQEAEYHKGCIDWNGNAYEELTFMPETEADSFSLEEVTIGIDFHWERKETQTFRGSLKIIVTDGMLCAVNILPVEEYLVSVISSEMSATASVEFLKAHAVISRSWLMAQMKKRKDHTADKGHQAVFTETEDTTIRWYDQKKHTLYDVCADDHCQRYQGITRKSLDTAARAVECTHGEVLMYCGEICDTRFSKCCGGMTEEYETCWEDCHKPYLKGKRDIATDENAIKDNNEEDMERWITGTPDAFCNTNDKRILGQILNNYDQETTDFYRWTVEYSQDEIARLLNRKLNVELGAIVDMIPIVRGKSGRISLLEIVGDKRRITIGKELEIRRALSENHLLSSAFVIERKYGSSSDNIPEKFILKGAGWGHGVGLCQIGAAVMGEKGYRYDEILKHYYQESKIEKLY